MRQHELMESSDATVTFSSVSLPSCFFFNESNNNGNDVIVEIYDPINSYSEVTSFESAGILSEFSNSGESVFRFSSSLHESRNDFPLPKLSISFSSASDDLDCTPQSPQMLAYEDSQCTPQSPQMLAHEDSLCIPQSPQMLAYEELDQELVVLFKPTHKRLKMSSSSPLIAAPTTTSMPLQKRKYNTKKRTTENTTENNHPPTKPQLNKRLIPGQAKKEKKPRKAKKPADASIKLKQLLSTVKTTGHAAVYLEAFSKSNISCKIIEFGSLQVPDNRIEAVMIKGSPIPNGIRAHFNLFQEQWQSGVDHMAPVVGSAGISYIPLRFSLTHLISGLSTSYTETAEQVRSRLTTGRTCCNKIFLELLEKTYKWVERQENLNPEKKQEILLRLDQKSTLRKCSEGLALFGLKCEQTKILTLEELVKLDHANGINV